VSGTLRCVGGVVLIFERRWRDMRPVVRKEEEGEMGADRADDSAGRGVVGLKTCRVDGGNG